MEKNFNYDKYIWVYGKHPVIEAIKNPKRKIKKIFIFKENKILIKKITEILLKNKKKILVEEVKNSFFSNKVAINAKHQGIIASCGRLEFSNYKNIFSNKFYNNFKLGLILDNITDINNVGAIYRSAFSFGVDFVITEDKNSPLENGALLNSSCGTYDKITSYKSKNINTLISEFKKKNWWIAGLDHLGEVETESFFKENKSIQKLLFILGSEGKGIRRLVKKNCDFLVKIKTENQNSSINVSNAAAIFLYEAYKNFKYLNA